MAEPFGLYLILTDPLAGYEACAQAAVDSGLRYLQLRMKNRPDREVLATARRLSAITKGSRTLFIVNDSVEIAIAADADGVHLGQDDMSLTEARRLWTAPGKRFGLSTHNPDQARSALKLKPDYIGVGPIYATPTKAIPDPTVGLEQMGRIVRESPLACVAIGGIDPDRLPEVLSAGAQNFAVVRAVNQASDPKAAIERLQRIWREHVGN